MALEPEFTPAAIAYLQAHADCGGVAGRAEMDEAQSYEFKSRKQRIHKIYPLGPSRWLCGGGLFRRCAIEQIGYLTNRNLHGYEEAELGIRLRQAGYRLERLNVPFFFHRSTPWTPWRLSGIAGAWAICLPVASWCARPGASPIGVRR